MLRLHFARPTGLGPAPRLPQSALWRLLGPLGLLALLAWPQSAAAADDEAGWQLRHSDEITGTQVYLRARGPDVPAFRAVARMPVRLSALVAVLLDSERMPEWVYRSRHVTPVERSGPTQGVSQVIIAMPWPLADREAIVAWQLTQDADTGVVTIEGHSAPDKLAPAARWVRMPSFESRWRFTALPDGAVEVRFEGHGDPGGSLAHPLLRIFVDAAVWQAPLNTVNALREVATRIPYRDAVLPFIREPAR